MSNLYKNFPHENNVKNNKPNFSNTKLGAFSMNYNFMIRLYNLIFLNFYLQVSIDGCY